MTTAVDDRLVWYVAYGSNLCATRLACYLVGGTPAGGRRATAGARDGTPPRDWRRVPLPHGLWFGGPSSTWDGGPAFLDVDRPGRGVGRAWLVTHEQLEDVVAQENGRIAGTVTVDAATVRRGGVVLPDAPYGRVVALPSPDARPCATVTYVRRPAGRAPDPAYLALVRSGLVETGVEEDEVRDLLDAHPLVRAAG